MVPEGYEGPTFEFGGERYPFEPAELLGSEVKLLKSRTGMSFPKYLEDLQEMGADGVSFYIWLTLTKAGKEPGKYSEFDFKYMEFLGSLDGLDVEEDPTPPPNRAARRKTSKRNSGGGRPSSRSTVAESPPTGS